jgi:hypothetical protein
MQFVESIGKIALNFIRAIGKLVLFIYLFFNSSLNPNFILNIIQNTLLKFLYPLFPL